MWKTFDPATLDLTGARTYTEAGPVIAGGRWHVLADETVVYETTGGTWQAALHTAENLADPTRFVLA